MIIKHTENDITYDVLNAFEEMKKSGDRLLSFEKGRYSFFPDYAAERVSCILNHDSDGYKKIGIPIIDFDGITIDGGGSDFVFHGTMLPIEITESKNVTLKNFSIDYPVSQYAHATVLEADANRLKLKIWDNSPFKVVNHSLKFTLGGDEYFDPIFFLDIDSDTDMIAEQTSRIMIENMDATVDGSNSSVVTLSGKELTHLPKLGNTLCLFFGQRFAGGIFVNSSENVTLDNVTIHHSLGMGVICQLSKNITLEAVNVVPSAGRYVSAYADATHFVNCRGDIILNNCWFEKHFDDCLNCHGIYMQIDKIIDSETVLARFVHHQQLGTNLFKPGENVELIDHTTLLTTAKNVIKSFEPLSRNLALIKFENALDESIKLKDCIESVDASPNLTVTNCTMRKAFPRGLLITTRGKVVVENNYFKTVSSAIHISGDANYWFESGCVRDVTIRNNIFNRCAVVNTKNSYVINIAPQIPEPNAEKGYYHKNITVTNNKFITAHENVLYAASTENLVFKDNEFDIEKPAAKLIACNGTVEL